MAQTPPVIRATRFSHGELFWLACLAGAWLPFVPAHVQCKCLLWPPMAQFGVAVCIIYAILVAIWTRKLGLRGFLDEAFDGNALPWAILVTSALLVEFAYFGPRDPGASPWVPKSNGVYPLETARLAEMVTGFLRLVVIAIVPLFVARMVRTFRETQTQQEDTVGSLQRVAGDVQRELVPLIQVACETKQVTEGAVKVLGVAGAMVGLAQATKDMPEVLKSASESGHRGPLEMMERFYSNTKSMVDSVAEMTGSGVGLGRWEALATPGTDWAGEDARRALATATAYLACFGEYGSAELAGVFSPPFPEFRTSFVHYARTVKAVVSALGQPSSGYEFYTLMVKTPLQFLNYVSDGTVLRTHPEWLDFLFFNHDPVHKHALPYRRCFLAAQNPAVEADMDRRWGTKVPLLARLRETVTDYGVVVKSDSGLPVLACSSDLHEAAAEHQWPVIDLLVAEAMTGLSGSPASPCFLTVEPGAEPTGLLADLEVRPLRAALSAFHSDGCCSCRALREDEFDQHFREADRPLDLFAVKDVGDGTRQPEWVCCLGILSSSPTWNDLVRMRLYTPRTAGEDGEDEWARTVRALDALFDPTKRQAVC